MVFRCPGCLGHGIAWPRPVSLDFLVQANGPGNLCTLLDHKWSSSALSVFILGLTFLHGRTGRVENPMVPFYPTLLICQIPELDFILPIAFPLFLGFLLRSRFRSRKHWIPIGPLAIRHFGFWSLGSPVPFRTFGLRRCLSKSNSIYKCMSKVVGCRLAGEGCCMRLRTLHILSHGLAGAHFLLAT